MSYTVLDATLDVFLYPGAYPISAKLLSSTTYETDTVQLLQVHIVPFEILISAAMVGGQLELHTGAVANESYLKFGIRSYQDY